MFHVEAKLRQLPSVDRPRSCPSNVDSLQTVLSFDPVYRMVPVESKLMQLTSSL